MNLNNELKNLVASVRGALTPLWLAMSIAEEEGLEMSVMAKGLFDQGAASQPRVLERLSDIDDYATRQEQGTKFSSFEEVREFLNQFRDIPIQEAVHLIVKHKDAITLVETSEIWNGTFVTVKDESIAICPCKFNGKDWRSAYNDFLAENYSADFSFSGNAPVFSPFMMSDTDHVAYALLQEIGVMVEKRI